MRVLPINTLNFYTNNNLQNNTTYYSQYRFPVLRNDTFCANPAKIYHANQRDAVIELAKYGVTCLCCGRKMILPDEFNMLKSSKFFKGNSQVLLERLEKYKKYMHPLERRIFNLLTQLHVKYPDKSLGNLLKVEISEIETKLIKKQSKVFAKIYKYCEKRLAPEEIEKLDKIFEISYDEIYGRIPKQTFSRKKFIGSIYKFASRLNSEHQKNLIKIAELIPSSKNEYEAFIVKYSRKNNKEIATRLLQKSVATIEHIKPRAEGGENIISNYAVECAEDNWQRGCRSMITQIQEHPRMPLNAQKQVNQIIKLVNNKKSNVNAKYVLDLKDSLNRASGGIIELNTDKLKLT